MSSIRLRSFSQGHFRAFVRGVPAILLTSTVLAGALLCGTGCAGAVESSRLEDRARRTVPVPICLKALERRSAGVVSALKPEDYWSLVLPSFEAGANTVDRSAPDCSGRAVFDKPELAEAEGVRSGALTVKPETAVITPASDGLRIVWLPTHRFANEEAAGPLALLRPREGFAEVYAMGFYRGNEKHSRFALERMGTRFVVTAGDEGCAAAKGKRCQSSFKVHVMRSGLLAASANLAVDRVEFRSMAGVPGAVQYRLTVTPVFEEKALRVVEQLAVRDENQSVLRKSDMERVFKLLPDGRLECTQQSLWDVEGVNAAPVATPPAPEPPGTPADGNDKGKKRK